ncbi:MAG: 3'-5' exonuclease, partial [Promethearchaeota archaeon]
MREDLTAWMQREKVEKAKSASSKAKPSAERTSLLKQLQKKVEKEPILPSWFPRQPKSGPPGVLLNVEYDGQKALAKLKLFDPIKFEVYEWLDTSGHHPYCFTDYSRDELSQKEKVVGHSGFLRFEEVSRFDLLHDRKQSLVSIVAKDPLAIGGRRESIREIIGRDHSWEADIRYTHCYTMDRALTPGLLYRVQNRELLPVPQEYSSQDAKEIRSLFEGDSVAEKLVSEYLPLFLTHATHIPRIALDIEVVAPVADRIPDPEAASSAIITISLADDTGAGLICLLRRDIESEMPEKQLSPNVQIRMFDEERKLLETVFHILWRTPLLLTYNGDNFDLRYLANRAKKLGIPDSDVPFFIRSSFAGTVEAHMKYGVHIDLYRFFHNRSIQIYAFGNQYREVRLEDVSQALLGEGKRELTSFIGDLSYTELADYCWQDSNLTMRLSQVNNDLVLNLILLLMRISHQGMHDLTRTAVSNWIRSLLYYSHRQREYLIPRQDEIAALKGEAVTEAIIKGKKYMGAIVVEPKAGVHFDVTVVDFASLYPSIMKAYNLSYETVRCQHAECKSNLVPETTHWICTKRKGLTSLIIGV